MTTYSEALARVQTRIQYHFSDIELLRLALTHPSYAHEHPEEGGEEYHNQRLEFLGDAVLDFMVAAWLYRSFSDFSEGPLTRLRATLVRTSTLARLAKELAIGEALRLGRGEEESGGRWRPANLCDAMEAVVGAYYLDSDLDTVWASLEAWFAQEAARILEAGSYLDAKSHFQEWAQAVKGITPVYQIVDAKGPDHAKIFTAQVLLDKQVVGQGVGHSKREAEQLAAHQALQRFQERGKQ